MNNFIKSNFYFEGKQIETKETKIQ